MPKLFFYDGDAPQQQPVYIRARKQYGCLGFLGDLLMIVITGGLWLLWIFVREMRRP